VNAENDLDIIPSDDPDLLSAIYIFIDLFVFSRQSLPSKRCQLKNSVIKTSTNVTR
jgi:hypothetical protein